MQGMREMLRGSLARSLRTLSEEDRLSAALPVVCGSALASHCRVDRLGEDRVLHLVADGREWVSSVWSMREVLRRDLARTAGVVLEGMQVEISRPEHAGMRARRWQATDKDRG